MTGRAPLVLGDDGLPQQLQGSDALNLGAWQAYTPSTAATTGTLTGSATGRYRKNGTSVMLDVTIAVTALSLGASGLTVGLPFAAAAYRYSVPGEVIGGSTLRGSIAASATTMMVTTYNAGSPLAVGTIVLTGFYESAT